MASQKIKRALFQILLICLGFGCASSSNKIAYCPKVGVISDLDRVSEMEVAGNQSKSNNSLGYLNRTEPAIPVYEAEMVTNPTRSGTPRQKPLPPPPAHVRVGDC